MRLHFFAPRERSGARAMPPRARSAPGGVVLIYVLVLFTCLMLIGSLAVDFGRVQVARQELETAALAAARYGAQGLSDGTYATKAIAAAAANMVDGTPLVLQNADIVAGTWTTGVGFTAGGASPNAIQINAYRIASRSTAIPLFFAGIAGRNTCDIRITGITVKYTSGQPVGFTGLTSFGLGKSTFSASYNSSVTTSPSHASYNSNGLMQSNGVLGVGVGSGSTLHGNAKVGPSGSVNGGLTVTGTTQTLSSAITATTTAMQVVTNPGGVSQAPNLAKNNDLTCPGGTYYFTSITTNDSCNIIFTGVATVYLNGNADLGKNCSITAYNNIPANLTIYQSSGNTFAFKNSGNFTGVYSGPTSDVTFGKNAVIEGAMMAHSIDVADSPDFFFDESLPGSGTAGVTLVH